MCAPCFKLARDLLQDPAENPALVQVQKEEIPEDKNAEKEISIF